MLSLAFALGQKLCRTLRRISVHSPPMRATFSATERFIKKNDERTASITPGNKKESTFVPHCGMDIAGDAVKSLAHNFLSRQNNHTTCRQGHHAFGMNGVNAVGICHQNWSPTVDTLSSKSSAYPSSTFRLGPRIRWRNCDTVADGWAWEETIHPRADASFHQKHLPRRPSAHRWLVRRRQDNRDANGQHSRTSPADAR